MITVSVVDDTPFVWNAEDANDLRTKYRIVGNLVGSLPRAPCQNHYQGLPLQLLPEEATLLKDKGIIKLIEKNKTKQEPSQDEVLWHEDLKKKLYEAQNKNSMEERRKDILRRQHEIIEGKRKKRKLPNSDAEDSELMADNAIQEILENEIKPLNKHNSLTIIHTAYPSREEVRDAIWNFPSTDMEKLRCHVFSHLWEQGYYLTSGAKFGGHFLVYPGDPARFHSFYVAVCKPWKDTLKGADLAAMGRLATGVKKTVLLCSEDEKGEIICQSLQWSGLT